MATPNRALILTQIAALLATVTSGNGYNTTIATVERVWKSWAEVGAGYMPWAAAYALGPERWINMPAKWIRVVMPIHILIHINASAETTRSTAINNAIDDIAKLVYANNSIGGYAVDWNIVGLETDEGHPEANDSRGGTVSVDISTEVVFHREAGATT